MVIQRWQSLLLFISLVLVAIFSVSNYATLHGEVDLTLNAATNAGYWLYNMAATLVLLVSIFMFRRLKLQQRLVRLAAFMLCGTAVWGYCYLCGLATDAQMSLSLGYSWILLAVAFVLAIVASCLIGKDYKLIYHSERLR